MPARPLRDAGGMDSVARCNRSRSRRAPARMPEEASMQVLAMLVLCPSLAGANGESSWVRWGGPTGDFKVVGPELVEAWPESGPRRLWEIELGDGYSAVLCRGDGLYTAYREGEKEIVVAIYRKSGALVWG